MIKKIFNFILPNETVGESKKKWDKLARDNARYFILSRDESQDENSFKLTGKEDYENFVLNDQILKEKFINKDKVVLEIGCGIGRMTEFFSPNFKNIYGVDISEEMIKKGKERLKGMSNIELVETNGVDLPFENKSIDLVFSYIVFQHMPTYDVVEKNLKEIKRILTSDGILKIQLRGVSVKKGSWYYGVDYDLNRIKNVIKKIGFELVDYKGENTKYFWLWLKNIND